MDGGRLGALPVENQGRFLAWREQGPGSPRPNPCQAQKRGRACVLLISQAARPLRVTVSSEGST
jgi:hypothetical protein